MFKLCKIKCAPKKGQTKARPKGWKRGFFSKGWRQLWVTVTRAGHRGGIQRRIRPSTWQSWQRWKKRAGIDTSLLWKSRRMHSEKMESLVVQKRTWNINDIDLHPCHGKGKNSVCFQSITYFLHNFFSSASSPLAICMAPPPNSPPSIRRSCVSWLITVSKQTGAVRPFAVINLLLSFCFRRAFVSGQKLGRR